MSDIQEFPILRSTTGSSKDETQKLFDGFLRFGERFSSFGRQLFDIHTDARVCFGYCCLQIQDIPKHVILSFPGEVKTIATGADFGLLVVLEYNSRLYTVWIPEPAHNGTFDISGCFSPSDGDSGYFWEVHAQLRLNVVSAPIHKQHLCHLSYLVIEDPYGVHFNDLKPKFPEERSRYLKSCWFDARIPADVWRYLINGSIYDPRHEAPIGKRFKCQQCAYAWWTYFHFLHQHTKKLFYKVLRDEIAFTVMLDQGVDGGWRHGCWYEDMECHARFLLDGVHLLLSQHDQTGGRHWLSAAECAMDFYLKHMSEELADGSLWFLHDTVEDRRPHHFASRVLGKSDPNSLCLNTHVQALTVLLRLVEYAEVGDRFQPMVGKGLQALKLALQLNGGGFLYKKMMNWIFRQEFRTQTASRWKRCMRPLRVSVYWFLRKQYPRLVQPCGFIERDLSLCFASHGYHVLNLKDLLVLYSQTGFDWLVPCIEGGIKYIQELDVQHWMRRDALFVELPEVLYLYGQLIRPLPIKTSAQVQHALFAVRNGISLDSATYAMMHFLPLKSPRRNVRTTPTCTA